MRRFLTAVLAVGALIPGVAARAATDVGSPIANFGPSQGGISSDNVEFIRHIPISTDGVGGKLVGRYFYTNDQNKIMIFDVKNAADPQLTGVFPLPQEWLFSREDLDGNGRILVVPNTIAGALLIIDVEDKSNPTLLAQLTGASSHTASCILDCKWVYNSNGQIVDLRNPAEPKLMKEKWGDGQPAQSGHDVTEVAPGIVLTASNPITLLDARKDPRNPKLLAQSAIDPTVSVMHTVRWANRATDKLFLAGSETNFKPRCGQTNGAVMTWSAKDWQRTHTFTKIGEYRMENGTFVDGKPTVNYAGGCSAHWLEPHPDFDNGGIAAAAFFEHGTRFLKITSTGKIKEAGYFMPWAGSTGAAYWITKEIVYTVDYNRGIDVIRFKG